MCIFEKKNKYMKRTILGFLALSLSIWSYGQEDYDEIFDDGASNSKINLGIDLMTLSTGTINFNASYNLTEKFQFKAGIGATPFGFIFDATALLSEEMPLLQSDLNTGYFLSGGIKYFTNKDHGYINSGAGAFYGVYLERWGNTHALNDAISYKRTKLNFVGGSNVGLFGNFTLDFEYGITLGYYTVETPNSVPGSYSQYELSNGEFVSSGSNLIYGINLGLGLNYKL